MDSELDPVMRCDSCQALVKLETLHRLGSCDKCGNRRIRNVTVMNEDEMKLVREWGFDEFADEWSQVDA